MYAQNECRRYEGNVGEGYPRAGDVRPPPPGASCHDGALCSANSRHQPKSCQALYLGDRDSPVLH